MSLDELLMSAKSEEDVKKEWIAFLNIKEYNLGKVDLSTKDCWFEFKYNRKEDNIVNIAYAELFNYVETAIKEGRVLPKFLIVANRFLFVMIETSKILNDLKHNDIDWSFTPSKPTMEAIDFVEQKASMFFRMFNVKKEEKYIKEYYVNAIENGEIIKTDITVNNIQDVYKNWYNCIGQYIIDVNKKLKLSEMQLNYIPKDKEYRSISNIIISLFYADIFRTDFSQHDIDNKDTAVITYSNTGIPYFILNNNQYTIGSIKNYNTFQNKYNIPIIDKSVRKELYARADLLLEDDVKKYIGAFYTPLRLTKKSIEYLQKHYDLNDYVIWDMCAGTGNLEMYLSNKSNVYLSTLNGSDVDTMKRSGYFIKNNVFQYDYLNDDIDAFGNIDYNISNKVPKKLQEAIKNKKVLVYINPPYAESSNNKKGVATNTIFSSYIKEYGKASNELFAQFMIRIEKEMPCAILGMYSTLKYVNAPNFVDFRDIYRATFIDGFIFQANKYFDGVKGSFPIGFLILDLKEGKINDVQVDVLDDKLNDIDKKTFYDDTNYLNKWIKRPKANNVIVPPLKNAIDITGSNKIKDKWSDNAIGYMLCDTNDLQHTGQYTALFSSIFGNNHNGGFYINSSNIEKASIIFAVRKMIKHTWLNDRDQFLIPDKELSQEFKNDCLIYMLFNGSNLSASAKLNYNNEKYEIINHFIPFTQEEVNAKEPFKSSFIYEYMKDKSFSKEALDVLNKGKKIWTKFFSIYDDLSIDTIIDKQLSNDAGRYQIRKTLEGLYGKGLDKDFKECYKILEDKLIPQVYAYGFLK